MLLRKNFNYIRRQNMKITIEGTEQEIKNILSTIGSSQEDKNSKTINELLLNSKEVRLENT